MMAFTLSTVGVSLVCWSILVSCLMIAPTEPRPKAFTLTPTRGRWTQPCRGHQPVSIEISWDDVLVTVPQTTLHEHLILIAQLAQDNQEQVTQLMERYVSCSWAFMYI